MWFLLIVLLTVAPGVSRVTVLNTFATYEACQPERNRVGFEMAEAYPGENDFLIVCEFHPDGQRVPVRLPLRQDGGVLGEHLTGSLTWKHGDSSSRHEPVRWDGARFPSSISAAMIPHA